MRLSAVREDLSLPQGSLAPVRVMLSLSLIAYYDPIRQTRRHMAISKPRSYTPCLRCAGAPRRPPSPSLSFVAVLSPRAVIRTPAGRTGHCPVADQPCTRLPQLGHESPPALVPSLPASDGHTVDAAMFASCCGSRVCLAPLAGQDSTRCPQELRHPRFSQHPSRDAAGGQARSPNGESATAGTFTQQERQPLRLRA